MNMFEELKAWADKWNVSYRLKEDQDCVRINFYSATWANAEFYYNKETGKFIWYGGE